MSATGSGALQRLQRYESCGGYTDTRTRGGGGLSDTAGIGFVPLALGAASLVRKTIRIPRPRVAHAQQVATERAGRLRGESNLCK